MAASAIERRPRSTKAGRSPRRLPTRDLGLTPDSSASRWWQVAISLVGLICLSPLSLLIALATKLSSKGPVIYTGQRIGRDMQVFSIYKFRTLLVDAEQRIGGRLLTATDPLYTPIGRFLKRSKFDEIPQLWNVIRGDMNLVGPRPIRPVFLATAMRDIVDYAARFTVRPGMTGLAQLRGGYFTDPRDKLRYDVLYIRNRGFWLDVKLVLATFVKLINKWLTLGLFLALMLLFASLAPGVFTGPAQVAVGGFLLTKYEVAGLLVGAAILVRQIPAHRFYLYRVPTNRPMACFVLFSIAAGLLFNEVEPRLRDAAYFTASGFLVYFLVVSGDMNEDVARRTTRLVALTVVGISLMTVLQALPFPNAAGAASGGASGAGPSTLATPVVLAAYLVLGFPLVLSEAVSAGRHEAREFWLACVAVVVAAVLLTQTRTGLFGLPVTAAVFTWRASRRSFWAFALSAVGIAVLLFATHVPEFSLTKIQSEWGRRVTLTGAAINHDFEGAADVLVGPLPGQGATSEVQIDRGRQQPEIYRNENMHLTLMLRTGVVGWALMMWVIVAALYRMYLGASRMPDERMRLTLWAIFSSGVGFLVSMANFNAFYVPSMQVMFWGLLGVGTAIETHMAGRRPAYNVVYRFGQGE
jgi:lipopolysaccharide/colanic/teichoic acid biosynthesis glycosyltransferase